MSKSLSAQRGVVVTLPFTNRGTVVLASGKNTTQLAPSNWSRTAAQADLYELYRFTRLRFRIAMFLSSAAGANDELVVMSYFSGAIDAAPALQDVNENPISCLFAPNQTTKSEWVDVPAAMLKGSLNWYKAIAGTMDSWDEVQGTLCVASANASSSGSVVVELEGTVEFTSPADPGATPSEKARRHNMKEKERLLKLLASSNESVSRTPSTPGAKGRDKALP